jgi:hypothetical protein
MDGNWPCLGCGVSSELPLKMNEILGADVARGTAEKAPDPLPFSQSVILCNRNTTPGPAPLWEQTHRHTREVWEQTHRHTRGGSGVARVCSPNAA